MLPEPIRARRPRSKHITLTARKEDTGKEGNKEISAESAGIHLYALHGVPEENQEGLTWDEAEAQTNKPLRWFRIDKKIVIALLGSGGIPAPETWHSGKCVELKQYAPQQVNASPSSIPGHLHVIVDNIIEQVTVVWDKGKGKRETYTCIRLKLSC